MDLFPRYLSLQEYDVEAFCGVHKLFRNQGGVDTMTELGVLIDTEGEGDKQSLLPSVSTLPSQLYRIKAY